MLGYEILKIGKRGVSLAVAYKLGEKLENHHMIQTGDVLLKE
jgi:hypothetical protein